MSKKIFCQHPFELENDPRILRLDKVFPDSGFGVFYKIRNRICLGGGQYALSGIVAELGGNNTRRKQRLERVLTDFDLFVIENGMVALAQGLTVSELYPRNARHQSNTDRLKQVQQNIQKGYDGNLFPEESRQMDEEALQKVQSEIRAQNQEQINSINHEP